MIHHPFGLELSVLLFLYIFNLIHRTIRIMQLKFILPIFTLKRFFLFLLPVLCTFLWLTSCRKPPVKTLVIISPHWDGIKREFSRAFGDWHEKNYHERIEIDWRDVGGTSDSLKYVISRFGTEAKGIGIDIFFGGGIDPFLELTREGLAEVYHPPESVMTGIPAEVAGLPVYDPEYHWFGAALSSFGIVANDRVLRVVHLPEVKKWADLTNPFLQTWIGVGDPRNSGAVHLMYEIILQGYGWTKGWEILYQIAGNVRSFEKNSSIVAKEAAYGNIAYAMTIDFYGLTQVSSAGTQNMHFILPEDYTIVSPDGICMLKGAPNQTYAKRFIDFVLSENGQKLWMLPVGHPEGPAHFPIERLCVRPDLYDQACDIWTITMNPFKIQTTLKYDANIASRRWKLLNSLIGATMIDVHPELVAAWKNSKDNPERRAEFSKIFLTENEALEILDTFNDKDAVQFRNAKNIEWQQMAQAKFRRLAR
ncbi:MAG: extracellular solute-binding protein [Candidatus Jettenia sp.]|nr:MAG: extracellular solute-binding protein [Candidatus Jettenia sp.]